MLDLHDRNQCPVEMQRTENVSFMIPKMLKSQSSNEVEYLRPCTFFGTKSSVMILLLLDH